MPIVRTHPQDPAEVQQQEAQINRAIDNLARAWYGWLETRLPPEIQWVKWSVMDALASAIRGLQQVRRQLPRPKPAPEKQEEPGLPGADWSMLDPGGVPAAGLPESDWGVLGNPPGAKLEGSDWGVFGNPPGKKLEGSEWPPFRGPAKPLDGSDWRSLDPNLPPKQLPGSDWRLLDLQIGTAILRALRCLNAVRKSLRASWQVPAWVSETLTPFIELLQHGLRSRGWGVTPDRVYDPTGLSYEY
jgi:hypothetical protein